MTKTGKRQRGRPRWEPTTANIEEIEYQAGRGLNQEQIAAVLGISYDTLNERKTDFPEISEAIKRGSNRADATIVNAFFENARGGNVSAQIFWLKSRLNWVEKSQVITEHTLKSEVPLDQIKQRIVDTIARD